MVTEMSSFLPVQSLNFAEEGSIVVSEIEMAYKGSLRDLQSNFEGHKQP